MKRIVLFFIGLCLLGLLSFALWDVLNAKSRRNQTYYPDVNGVVMENTFENYSWIAKKAALEEGVPAAYILAVIALESSGRKVVPRRFEKHVYKKLIELSSSKLKSYNGLQPKALKGMNTSDIKKAASSWGPCQIMGYHALHMNLNVEDFESDKGVLYAAKWMNLNYKKFLDREDWKSAFHMHNTGKPYPRIGGPRTHNKKYVSNGLVYMKAFQEKLKK